MVTRMTHEEIAAYRKREKAEAQAAEEKAVYNLGLIHKLEKRLDAQAKAIKALSNLINSVKELSKAELALEVDELEKSIKKSDAEASGWIEALQAELSSRWVPNLGDRIGALENVATALCVRVDAHADALSATSAVLDDERRKNETLTRLVVRMGEAVNTLTEWYCNAAPPEAAYIESSFPLTPAGQAEYDAAMHEAEGEPEGHGLVEDVQ